MKGFFGFLFLMSPAIILVVWIGLTWLLWKGGRRFMRSGQFPVAVRIVLIVVVATAWFGWSIWEAGGKKMYWDAKVRELCAIDGGVRVYETVELTPKLLDQFGRIQIPEKSKAKLTDAYYYVSESTYLKTGKPNVMRMHTQIIRKSDEKVLGEIVRYGRGGGDFPGPWHGSYFTCPDPTKKPYLETSIFLKGK